MDMPTKHILVPLDESEEAELSFNDAAVLARSLDADITLLEVVQPLGDVIKTRKREVCIDRDWPGRVRRAVGYLLSVAERPVWKGLSVRAALEFGEIAETVTAFARFHSMDCIVWPPASLGAAVQSALVADSPPHSQPSLVRIPARPSRWIFEHGLTHKETTEPWILRDFTENLTT
jgi:nucleotide-binding universal stress UspA family protein